MGLILNSAGKRMRRSAGFAGELVEDVEGDVATGVAPKTGELDSPWLGAARQWRRLPFGAVREGDPR